MQPIKNADLKNADIYQKTPENMKNMKNKVSGKSRKTNRISKRRYQENVALQLEYKIRRYQENSEIQREYGKRR